MSLRRRNNPFTLLEVVLAVTIFAVMTGMVAGIVYALPRTWNTLNSEAARLEGLTRVDRFADLVVRNAVPFAWTDDYGKRSQVFTGHEDWVLLAARRRITGDGSDGGFNFVAFGLRDDRLTVEYRGEPILFWEKDGDDIVRDSVREEVLIDGVKRLTLRYADWADGELKWREEWDCEEKKEQIPAAIAWELEFNDGSVVKYLRRTAGNSYYTSYGRRDEAK